MLHAGVSTPTYLTTKINFKMTKMKAGQENAGLRNKTLIKYCRIIDRDCVMITFNIITSLVQLE